MTISPNEELQPLSDHIYNLRKALFLSLLFFIIAFCIACPFASTILHFLLDQDSEWKKEWIFQEKWINSSTQPQYIQGQSILPGDSILITKMAPTIIALSPTEALFVEIRISLWIALTLAFPLITWPLLSFFWPALLHLEKKIALLFSMQALVSLFASLFIAWKITIPWALSLFTEITSHYSFPLYNLRELFDFFESIALLHLLFFQLFALFLLLVGYGVIEEKSLQNRRKEAILAIFIIAAILTPPDIFSQLALACPLCVLYECLLLFGKLIQRRRRKETRIYR